MDQICQVCLIPYLLHTAGPRFCPSRYNQQAGTKTMCLWSQLQFIPHNNSTQTGLSDVIGMENQITCYEAQMLPKLKVTGKLIEEISCSPSSPKPEPVKLKPNSTSEAPRIHCRNSF